MVALAELVEFKGGGTPSKAIDSYWGGDIPWASVKDFKSTELNVTVDSITIEGLKNSASNLIPAGNLIVPTRMALGKVAINSVDVAINQDLRALIVKNEKTLDKRYLLRFLESKAKFLESEGKGATVKGITQDVLKNLDVPLPPLPEQKRIAAILDKADSLRRKNQQAIQLADKFLRAVFLDLFGDPVTNLKGWDESLLSQLCNGKMNNGIFKKNEEYGDGKPVAWVGELFGTHEIIFSEKTNKVTPSAKEIDKYGMNYGDILFCRSSLKLEGIGWSNVYLGKDNEALFECHVIRMPPKLDYINPVFLNFQLRLPGIRRRVFAQAKTVTMTTIDQEGLGKVKVIIPNKELQDKFEKIHRKTIGSVKRFDQQHEADNLFNALSQKAFSGKI